MALTPRSDRGPAPPGEKGLPRPRAPARQCSVLGLVFFFFFFLFPFFAVWKKQKTREDAFSDWLTQTLWTNPGQPRWTEAFHWPQSKSTREDPMLPARRHLSFLACSPAARAAPTRNHCAPPPVIRVLSSLFSFH